MLLLCLSGIIEGQAQGTYPVNFGTWKAHGLPGGEKYPEVNGNIDNISWREIETAPDVWNWAAFDSDVTAHANDSLPFVFMVFTKEDAPDWLFTNGVPKVIEKDALGNVTGYAPYYADPEYKFFFKRMITKVRQHIETLPTYIRQKIVAMQACFGNTGDYISYKGEVAAQYALTSKDFYNLFTEFSMAYYNEYKNTNPKIVILSNPQNTGSDQFRFLLDSCPGGWIKVGTIGKGFQLNDEKAKKSWLYDELNSKQGADYLRSRSEITGGATGSGWWNNAPCKNMFALMCYGIYWGLDMSNQGDGELSNTLYDSSFLFFNKYNKSPNAKDPAKSVNAMCALKDVLDAADGVRFPAATYGSVSRTNTQRYRNIANAYLAYGAKLDDIASVSATEMDNLAAKGINDVGWDLLDGNYDRYMHQIKANETSVGYWNVQSADVNAMYGKFARGFDIPTNKKALYFDVDNAFLNYAPLNGKYSVKIDVTYLDDADGSWQLYYDSKTVVDKASIIVNGTGTNKWKTVSVTINDANFGDRGPNASDFSIRSVNNKRVIFAIVELSRPAADLSNVGLFVSTPPVFDTICLGSTPQVKDFTLNGSFLNGTNVVVGPLAGYTFSTSATGVFNNTLSISGYGTFFNQQIFIKFNPAVAGVYSTVIPVTGGGANTLSFPVKGVCVNTAPILNTVVSNVSCYNSDNGNINVTPVGGTGPFTYNWVSSLQPSFKPVTEDISLLKPATYTVTVTALYGCKATAAYVVTEPAVLDLLISADSAIVCKNGNTTVFVNATGGNLPYTGTGHIAVSSGSRSYTVTDAKGCTKTESFFVSNGNDNGPAKPGTITGADADAKGVCGTGKFTYSIMAVAGATSYTWKAPVNTTISSANGTSVTITAATGFRTGSLTVTANNTCGISTAASKSLTSEPGKPGSITGPASVAKSKTGIVYTVSPVVAGLSYSWTVNNGAKITAGQNTTSITVTWGTTAGKVTVKASNNCGSSGLTTKDVTIGAAFGAANATAIATESLPSISYDETVLNIMPNPAKDIAYLVFNSNNTFNYTLQVVDITGRNMVVKTASANIGENRVAIDVSRYTSGLYMVTLLNADGRRKTIKLIKQ